VPSSASTDRIRGDFDRLARLNYDRWDHNRHYHPFLLARVPSPCREALEIGCGAGEFSHALADCSGRVIALDLSPEMIRVARARGPARSNLEFQLADASTWPFPSERFDCIATIAALHHLDARSLLPRMRDALRPGGVLLVLDLVSNHGLLDLLRSAHAVAVSGALRLAHTGRLRDSRELRKAWKEHGRGETYLRLSEVREICRDLLPGAEVQRQLLWRYSIVWRKAGAV
jgi:SAM-dependent methyltransferase